MTYELFLRGAAALDEEVVQEIGRAVAELGQEGERGGGQAVRWELYQEHGVTRGVDIVADLDQPGAGALLCRAAFAVAAARGLAVFDPQLGRPVMEGDAAAVEAQAERVRAFIEGGVISAGPARLSPGARLWLVVALLLAAAVALSMIGRSCVA